MMKKRVWNVNKKAVATFFALVLGCLIAFKLIAIWESRHGMALVEKVQLDMPMQEKQDAREMLFYQGNKYVQRANLETFLLIGLDKYEKNLDDAAYRNSQHADFLLLIIIDKEQKNYQAIQLNRDTITSIQTLDVLGNVAQPIQGQLALAYTYGSGREDSCKNTVATVSDFLYGVEINHYISLTMDVVSIINDLVGGVPLTLLDDFTKYDPVMVQGETVHLTGEMAITYVRERKELEDSTNISRMVRQRQYLTALEQQCQDIIKNDNSFLLNAILQISSYMVSDCTVQQLADLVDLLAKNKNDGILTIAGTSVMGKEFMEFYADEVELRQQILTLLYEQIA